MKKITLLGAMAAALLLSGCTKVPAEHGENGGRFPEGTRIYINAGLALPTASGTRSATDDDENDGEHTNSDATPKDHEYGHDYESDVRSVLLVIADSEDKYITHTFVSNVSEAPVSGKKFDFVVTGELSYEDLEKAYNGTDDNGTNALLKMNQEVHVWVYCNYTGAMVEKFGNVKLADEDWINFTGTVEEKPANPSTSSDIPNTIWAKGSFLMTNANNKDNVFTFPEKIEDWDPYTDKSNPYLLSKDENTPDQEEELRPIHVERAAARIDFRDASPNKNLIYPLTYITKRPTGTAGDDNDPPTDNGESLKLFSVKLNRMSLVNMSKNFYYLRRVSADGTATGAKVGGYEYYRSDTDCNYVVDTDYSDKNGKKIGAKNDYFNFPLFTADSSYNREAWYVDKISDVVNNEDFDNWEGSASNKYHIWRYVTENTIPGIDNQITVQSTGIVFKGSIILGDDGKDGEDGEDASKGLISQSVKNALIEAEKGSEASESALPDLYSFEGRLYAGISELVSAAAESKGSTLNTAVNLALKHWKADSDSEKFVYHEDIQETDVLTAELFKELTSSVGSTNYPGYTIDFIDTEGDDDALAKAVYNFNKAVAKVQPEELGITIYRASNEEDGDGWGYYCYYFYWNRHNDNEKSGKMGPMEFATVRNNVYKLAVTKISEFGHPRVTDFDPDPVEPKDPDEEPKVYFQVQVDVLPWVVRVNDIEF